MNEEKWFSVRTVYQYIASGRPKRGFSIYSQAAVMIEERVVLFRAKSEASAIAFAEEEAKEYASDSYVNPFGQKVIIRYVGCGGAFQLFDAPSDGIEVHSSTEIQNPGQTLKELKTCKFGKTHGKREAKMRLKFQNTEFTRIGIDLSGRRGK